MAIWIQKSKSANNIPYAIYRGLHIGMICSDVENKKGEVQ